MHICLLWRNVLSRHRMRGCLTFSTVQPKVAAVGIDFGCKNSRVAIVDSLVPEVVHSETGSSMPSYVTTIQPKFSGRRYAWALQQLDGLGKCVAVGELAKRRMSRQPSHVIFNIKKLVRKQFDDHNVQEMRKRVHFSIVEGDKGEALVEICGMQFSPVELASVIFARLKDIILMHQYHHELKVVISVPIFFDEQQREDIILAGRKAGLKILQLIDEPIAAALSSTTVKEGTIVVFGMGAGSYNVSILGVSGTNIEIKTQFGNPCVGGDQFDDILLDYFVTKIRKSYSVDIRGDKYALMLLAEDVEQAKVELSSQHKVTVSLPYIISSVQCDGDPSISISRAEFENLGVNLAEHIQEKCQTLLETANISSTDIDEVILTGGMTRVPMIQKLIHEVFGKRQGTRVNNEEAVVIGSAIQAALIVEDEREMSKDITPLSIGIESEGFFVRVIPRHTTIPTKQTVKFPAWCAYGECLPVKIYLGEHFMVHHNVFLGEVELINNQGSCQGSVYFELTFEVNKDYVVKVSGRNVYDQPEAAYDASKALKVFPVREIMMCKHNVDKAVKNALLDWRMHATEIHARLICLARYILNSLSDVLAAMKDEVPVDLSDHAEKAMADLLKALDGDAHVLKDKMLVAELAKETILNWRPSSESHGDYSDYED
ncbi:hypothetical protein ACQJBY_036645 [Aegilops geniculata]